LKLNLTENLNTKPNQMTESGLKKIQSFLSLTFWVKITGLWMLAESFCKVKNRSSIIMSKSLSKNLSNENKHTLCFQRIGILFHVLSWRQQKTPLFVFITETLLRTFWRSNWLSIFDVVKGLRILWPFKVMS